MEKYRKFADSFTGKNPFLPIQVNSKTSIGAHLTHWLLGLILIILRIPILLITLLFLSIHFCLVSKLIPVASLRRVLDNLANMLGFRVILGCFGFFSVPTPTRLGLADKKAGLGNLNGYTVFSNHTSPIDIFYLQLVLNPVFGRINYGGEHQVGVDTFDFIGTLKLAFSRTFVISQQSSENKKRIGEIARENFKGSRGPLVLFYEGCNTNGNGVLQCKQELLNEVLEGQSEQKNELIAFNIQYKRKDFYTPINTCRSGLLHLFILMSNFSNNMKVNAKVIQQPQAGKNAEKEFQENFVTFYKSCGQQILGLDYNTYVEFFEFWLKTQSNKSGSYTKEVKTEKIGQKYM